MDVRADRLGARWPDKVGPPKTELSLLWLLVVAAAAWTASAGIIHFVASTVPDHHSHALLLAFFVGSGVMQVAWAMLALRRPSPRILAIGAAGNALVVMVWIISRGPGIPFVNGGVPEAAGFPDIASTVMEGAAAAGLALAAVLPSQAAGALIRRGPALAAGAVGVAAALLLPSVIVLPEMDAGSQMSMFNTAATTTSGHPNASGHGGTSTSADAMPNMHDGSAPTAPHQLGQQVPMPMSVMSSQPGSTSAPGTMGGSGAQVVPDSSSQMAMTGSSGASGGSQVPSQMQMPQGAPQASASQGAQSPPPMEFWGHRVVVRYGPISLPPNWAGSGLHNLVAPQMQAPCSDCLITGVVPDMVYADGSQANIDTGVMLHHVVIFDTTKTDYTCSRHDGVGALGRRIFASGNERTAVSMPKPFGVDTGSGPWAGLFDLMNMSTHVRNVFLQFTIYDVPASTAGIKQVVPVWLDENNCGDSEFSVPAGRSDKVWNWPSTLTGRVIVAGGHVHDGGVSITASDPTEDEHLCTAVAAYGTKPHYDGNISSMAPVCAWDRLGVVRAGDTLRLDAVYDTPKPLSGVMGIMLLAVYPTNDLAGGTSPPAGATGPPSGSGTSSSSGSMGNMPGMS